MKGFLAAKQEADKFMGIQSIEDVRRELELQSLEE